MLPTFGSSSKSLHTAHDRSYATNDEGEPEYQNTFIAIPSKVPATPHRTTRRPKIEGTQVALGRGTRGRGNPPGRIWPHQSLVPLGPPGQERRLRHLLDSRGAELGGRGLGRPDHPAHRHGGHGHASRRRPGPAAGDGGRAERQAEGALFPPGQQNQEHLPLQHAQGQGLQRADLCG